MKHAVGIQTQFGTKPQYTFTMKTNGEAQPICEFPFFSSS